jgi:hypothetical protein
MFLMYLQIRLLVFYYYFVFLFIQIICALCKIRNKIIMITTWFINFVRHMLQHVTKYNETC